MGDPRSIVCHRVQSALETCPSNQDPSAPLLPLGHVFADVLSLRGSRNDALGPNTLEPGITKLTRCWHTSGQIFIGGRGSLCSSPSLRSSKSLPGFHKMMTSLRARALQTLSSGAGVQSHPKRVSSPVWLGLVSSAPVSRMDKPRNSSDFFFQFELWQLD